MVKLTAGTGPIDFSQDYLYFLPLDGRASSISSTQALFEGGYTFYSNRVIGTGFADPDGDSRPDSGTVKSLEVSADGAVTFTISALNMSYSTFEKAAATYSPFFPVLLTGADQFHGSAEADDMNGYAGNDVIYGNGGDDILIGGLGNDRLDGGAGNDRLIGTRGEDQLFGGDGDDQLGKSDSILSGRFLIDGGEGFDRWSGDFSASTVGITIDGNVLTTEAGVSFGPGRTARRVESFELRLGHGDDTFRDFSGGGDDFVGMGGGKDKAYVSAGRDQIYGYGGDELFVDYSGADAALYSVLGAEGYFRLWEGPRPDLAARSLETSGFQRVTVDGSRFADRLVGSAGNDTLKGAEGNDVLVPQLGKDVLDGGAGTDTLAFSFTAFVRTFFHGNLDHQPWLKSGVTIDLTRSSGQVLPNYKSGDFGLEISPLGSVTLRNIENVEGTGLGDDLRGNALSNRLAGLAGNDLLDGRDGDDDLEGGDGNDTLIGGAGQDRLDGGGGVDTASYATSTSAVTVDLGISGGQDTGGAGVDVLRSIENLTGGAGSDRLTGNSRANVLNGGRGADTMTGGAGDDLYVVDNVRDKAVETSATGGIDQVYSSVTYTLDARLEKLVLTGGSAISGTGNELANSLTGNAAANGLSGGAGNDRLDGGLGADRMAGGSGNDVYVVDNGRDTVSETSSSGGIDTVISSVSFTLGANVERLMLAGTGAINGSGNGGANILTGNAAANRLDGKAGADAMKGGAGNDIYHVDNRRDAVTELANEGTDAVVSTISFVLGAELENLTLAGAAAIDGTGNSLANNLTGNAAANRLDGKGGADTMTGGAGNDVYYVSGADKVVETSSAGGIDLVVSTVDYTLGRYVERLMLSGSAALAGNGNSIANILYGNNAANRLDGKDGADIMEGRGGDDLYYVDNVGDQAVEARGGGIDTVSSRVSFTLGAHVERLVLAGTSAIDGTGNSAANILTGNRAANALDGKGGADTMQGEGGNDTYHVDHEGDVVTEAAGQGRDTVVTTLASLTLAAEVENLAFAGSGDFAGTGNGLDNVLSGAAGEDTLAGGGGDDDLYGRAGNDSLEGGAGADRFRFDTALDAAANVDALADFVAADDTMLLSLAVFTALGAPGTLSDSAFASGTAAADADDRIVYDSATGSLWYDADGSGAAAEQILFATVAPATALTAADFIAYA